MSRGNAEDLIEASPVSQVACLSCQRMTLYILKGRIREAWRNGSCESLTKLCFKKFLIYGSYNVNVHKMLGFEPLVQILKMIQVVS